MKTWFFVLILLTGMLQQHSCIDQLQTTEEVRTMIASHYPDYNPHGEQQIVVKSTSELAKELDCQGLFKKWDVKNWEKIDLNNDGRTDLIAIISYYSNQTVILLDHGNKNIEFKPITSSPYDRCQLVKPINFQGKNLLKISRAIPREGSSRYLAPVTVVDTLSFFNNHLVEYNPNPSDKTISSITFETTACFGSCPEYQLKISENGHMAFKGIAHTPIIGATASNITQKQFQHLEELLNYIDVMSLKSNYAVNWTDDQSATLTIRFKDGTEKQIQDYGLRGTSGLEAVYSELQNLVKSLNAQ